MIRTGWVYFRDEYNKLWIAESFVDPFGMVTTQQMMLPPEFQED